MSGARHTAVQYTGRLCCVHAHQAVICAVCLTSADHVRAPEQVHRECVHAGLVIHNGHSYTLQVLIRLICFEEGGGG